MNDKKDPNLINVLLIDDDEDEFVLIRDLLKEVPGTTFQLDWVSNYERAKSEIVDKTNRSHDVCLLDYRLGSHTGLELLRELNADGYKVPIIFLTGYGDGKVDREAMRIGATDYLMKSELNTSLLDRAIHYAIYRTQLQKQMIMHERMASIGLLASGLAHDIGTPLGVIRGRAEYLEMQLGENASAKNTVNIIIEQIDRISGLIRSLLNLARGDQTISVGVADFNRAANDVFSLMEHEMQKHNIVIKNNLGEQKILVKAESEKLHQVLLNIIMNAVHAIKTAQEGGKKSNHSIIISVEDLGAQWGIYIQDTGCGISKDNLKQVFRPFFSTKEMGTGTGLGLSTAQWILQSWGGSIDVSSQEGVGTTIKLRIMKAS